MEALQAAVRIPTVSRRDGVDTEVFDALLAELERRFPLLHERLELTRVHTHGLLFRWCGASDAQPVVLMAHLDVVPIEDESRWTHPPFSGAVVDGVVWGRGTLDDKGCVVAICSAVEELLEDGHEPAQDVWLSFGCDEEVFGQAAPEAVAVLRERGVEPWFVLDEGGAVAGGAFPGVSAPVAVVGVTEKGVTSLLLRAEGRGFNAGVDIKEMQHTSGFDALIGANKGCYAAFKAVYECSVPVIAAVNGFCVGGGVGLVGNADCIVASDDAYFGVPEVNQGALGAATHMARLVPPHMLRTLYFTARTIKAVDLVQFGSVLETVPREELMDAALRVATDIASKDTRVIRAAKEALNGIDPVDVNKSYRFEQGFTFELNLAGVADELRDEFAGTEKSKK